jgi:hypothetical protein
VIDPTKVTRTALQNASSVAGLMLTTDAMVAELVEEKKGGGGHSTAACATWAAWAAWTCNVIPRKRGIQVLRKGPKGPFSFCPCPVLNCSGGGQMRILVARTTRSSPKA